MSKTLDKAQSDLDTLKAELEAWIASQPPQPPTPRRRPAVRRTRVELIEAACEPVEDVDTSWVDLLETPATAPTTTDAPLFVDGRELVAIEIAAPQRERYRDRIRREWNENKAAMA